MGDRLVDLFARMAASHVGAASGGQPPLVIGLAGRGIQASRTPGMHEREAARLGIGYSYLLLDFDKLGLADSDIGAVIAAARAAGFQGLNVTHPFKQTVIAALDRLAPDAQAIGAVNTVVFTKGAAEGHNTDSWGFAEAFREAMTGADVENVVMLGAGGAGAAVAYALLQLGIRHLSIFDTTTDRANELAQRMQGYFPGRVDVASSIVGAIAKADGVVNTTPVGMAKYPGTPFEAVLLEPHQWVADIIYFPAETELLRQARALGCRTMSGMGMAIFQAVRAFELFTGRTADRAAMAGHFEAAA